MAVATEGVKGFVGGAFIELAELALQHWADC